MPPGEARNDDDYVVSLLLKDADANKKRYLTNSLGSSLLSRSSRSNAPKPNTKFLKNIIRETDTHNAALKAKEEEESRMRLRELRKEGDRKRVREEDEDGSSKRRRREDKPGRWANVLNGLDVRSGRESGGRGNGADGEGSKRRRRERSGRSRERHRNDDRKQRRDPDNGRSSRTRSRSREHRKADRRRATSRSPSNSKPPTKTTADSGDSDSDPLDDIIGPKPPPKSLPRGRGAFKPSSSIDARFAPSYNPKTDVDLSLDNGDRDDWDMALEALRDRAKWRASGAQRLRDAGFSEDEVRNWEGSSGLRSGEEGGEKDVEDVRWRKRGEGREWDRGKVVSEDGGVEVRAEWGRLKGT